VLVLAALLAAWALFQRRHERRRTEQLVARAREEALAEAGVLPARAEPARITAADTHG
jgi:hypothetical protein